jgi:uncharacterized protein YjeT (DUF2065 family)
MWESLVQALCLVLIIEGIIPFVDPKRWRRMVFILAAVTDRQLRLIGLVSMLLGAAVLCLV